MEDYSVPIESSNKLKIQSVVITVIHRLQRHSQHIDVGEKVLMLVPILVSRKGQGGHF